MRRIICCMVGSCLLAGAGVPLASAQKTSLADLARREQARRKATKRPVKVYTNADVPVTHAPTAATAMGVVTSTAAKTEETAGQAEAGAGQPAQAGARPGAKPGAPGSPAPGVVAGDEAKWRARITQARENLSRAQLQLEGMRTRVLHLQTTKVLSGGADANQQAAIQRQQQDSLQEFEKLRADVERFQRALADVEAEARAAGVPAGWLH
jgi:hypothetical protein